MRERLDFVYNKTPTTTNSTVKTSFEKKPLEILSQNGELMSFKHIGFWKCMDNLGDKKFLDKICKENKKVPWVK